MGRICAFANRTADISYLHSPNSGLEAHGATTASSGLMTAIADALHLSVFDVGHRLRFPRKFMAGVPAPLSGSFCTKSTATLVWKGVEGDNALYTSSLRGLFWQPQDFVAWVEVGNGGQGTATVGRPFTSAGPGLVSNGQQLLMVWRGSDPDQDLWFTQAAPDATTGMSPIAEWSTQAHVAGYASSSRPSVAVFLGRTFLAWKGNAGDHGIYTTYV